MNIDNCKTIKDYLTVCKVASVDNLTDEQVLDWAKTGKMGLKTKISANIVEFGMFGKKPNRVRAIQMLKQAIVENKVFSCTYILRESCDGPIIVEGDSEAFSMKIK